MRKLVVAMIILVVVFLAVVLLHSLKRNILSSGEVRQQAKQEISKLLNIPERINFDARPDRPVNFGYKCQWYAVGTTDTEAVAESFGLEDLQAANWQTGIAGAYGGYYYVSPPVKGWTLVVNSHMADSGVPGENNPIGVVKRLSAQYGEAYYFGTHRVVEYHAWIKGVQGEIIRAYGYVGESSETLMDEGDPTKEEIANDLVFAESHADYGRVPHEEDVIEMASLWTVSPFLEDGDYETGTGLAGTAKAHE
ncbi:hypothetical protein [Paenibacillus sp. P46E]|uniref:hypothetical protein n=1 Tax=Paenibacillus sp. P46E TaxID=1349436 RepID=UPI00095B837B|nr:hypothetical protein [Paenibacillus sp. P46E]OKP99122.1 hypothetical protein A3849_06700 [Paenibacillus sp. P46E]